MMVFNAFHNLVSSAIELLEELTIPYSMSRTRIRNKGGPRKDPCGTPKITGVVSEYIYVQF